LQPRDRRVGGLHVERPQIYGSGYIGVAKRGRYDPGVRGRVVAETAWDVVRRRFTTGSS
jgi:hypothetical protein